MRERLPLVRDTIRFMISQMKEQDRLALVFYDAVSSHYFS